MHGRRLGRRVAVGLAACGVVGAGCGDSQREAIRGRLDRSDVVRVARRVEEIRGLHFKRVPPVELLSAAEAVEREKQAADEAPGDDDAALEELVAAEDILKLLGLIEPTDDLADL